MSRNAPRLSILAVILVAAASFLPGITWGLPSRAPDPYLFGPRIPWTGQQILDLAGTWSDNHTRGADVDLNPLAHSTAPILLNDTDAQRAEIIRRYRLFSYQPDEMITFRALASMHGHLDPHLYQYGGLWIYPVGLLLKLASFARVITLTPNLAFYLDHPDAFARFYVVARLYTAAWAAIGALCVHALTRRLTPRPLAPIAATLCYLAMPVVINMAHEAKPHLPGAVLMLATILAATRYIERPSTKRLALTVILAGFSVGMVLSSLPILAVPIVAPFLLPTSFPTRLNRALFALLLAIAAYAITNPFVPINALFNPQVLHSNFANSAAMYSAGDLPNGILNACDLILAGTSPALAIAGLIAALLWSFRYRPFAQHPASLFLAIPSLLVVLQFTTFAAHKPGEFARFALLPDIALAIAACVALASLPWRPAFRAILLFALFIATAVAGQPYLLGFIRDARPVTTRLLAAAAIQQATPTPGATIAIAAEPAPYCCPPLDLFQNHLLLLPPTAAPTAADLHITLAHSDPTPISWASKSFALTPAAPNP